MQGRCRNPCCPVCEDKSWQAPLQPKGLKPVPVRGRSSPGQSEAPPWVTSIHKKSPVRATLPRYRCRAPTGLVIWGDQLPRATLRSALGFTARLKAGSFQPFGLKALETYCSRPPDHRDDRLRAARKKCRTHSKRAGAGNVVYLPPAVVSLHLCRACFVRRLARIDSRSRRVPAGPVPRGRQQDRPDQPPRDERT